MKALNNAEMRSIEGGYRLRCQLCGKTKHTFTKAGVTAFYFHKAGHQQYVIYDIRNYSNAMKWWG